MKEIYIVTQYDRPVIAMESEHDATSLAKRLGGRVEPVQLVERRRERSVLGEMKDADFAGGVVR